MTASDALRRLIIPPVAASSSLSRVLSALPPTERKLINPSAWAIAVLSPVTMPSVKPLETPAFSTLSRALKMLSRF